MVVACFITANIALRVFDCWYNFLNIFADVRPHKCLLAIDSAWEQGNVVRKVQSERKLIQGTLITEGTFFLKKEVNVSFNGVATASKRGNPCNFL